MNDWRPSEITRGVNRLALRRRTFVERRVLALLRGGGGAFIKAPVLSRRHRKTRTAIPSAHAGAFFALREAAMTAGMQVQAADVPYLSQDELQLLAWLAQSQRVVGLGDAVADVPALRAALLRCADVLNALELRLSPLTLYGTPPRTARSVQADRDGRRKRRRG